MKGIFSVAGILAVCLSVTAKAEPVVIDADAAFPEGPAVIGGTLYYAQYGANKVSAWDGAMVRTLWESAGCGPSAVVPMGADLFVTCYDNGTVVRIGMDGSTLATISSDDQGAPLVGPNDGTPDGQGGVWFTASGPWESGPIVGKVYHLGADGAVKAMADDLHYANGIVLWNGRLHVNESEAGRVISFAIGDDGALSDRRLFLRVADVDAGSVGSYPDGIKVGPDGNLWIGQYSAGRIVVVASDGSFVRAIDVPSPAAPNLAFSADGKTVFVAAVDDTANPPYAGKVYAVPIE